MVNYLCLIIEMELDCQFVSNEQKLSENVAQWKKYVSITPFSLGSSQKEMQ